MLHPLSLYHPGSWPHFDPCSWSRPTARVLEQAAVHLNANTDDGKEESVLGPIALAAEGFWHHNWLLFGCVFFAFVFRWWIGSIPGWFPCVNYPCVQFYGRNIGGSSCWKCRTFLFFYPFFFVDSKTSPQKSSFDIRLTLMFSWCSYPTDFLWLCACFQVWLNFVIVWKFITWDLYNRTSDLQRKIFTYFLILLGRMICWITP